MYACYCDLDLGRSVGRPDGLGLGIGVAMTMKRFAGGKPHHDDEGVPYDDGRVSPIYLNELIFCP